jgi:ligand-binding SRPBCC domain-containing protein
MNNNQPAGSAKVLPEQIDTIKRDARSMWCDESAMVAAYKAERERGLSDEEASELIRFAFWAVKRYTKGSVDEYTECYWEARNLGKTHRGAMRLLEDVKIVDLRILFDNWARYVKLKDKGLSDREAAEVISDFAQLMRSPIDGNIALYWRVRKLGSDHADALGVVLGAEWHWGDAKLGVSKYSAARRQGWCSSQEAFSLMRIAARYADMPMEDLIECYSRLHSLGASSDEAFDIMSYADIRNPKCFELWPYYEQQRKKCLPVVDAVTLVFRVPTYVDAPIENIIEFYWRARRLLGLSHFDMKLMTTDNVTDPKFFELWPYYEAQRARGLTWVEARQLIKKAASLTRVSIEDCVEFYWRVRHLGGSHNDALAVMDYDNISDPNFYI